MAQSPVLKQRTLSNADYVRAFKEYDPQKIYQIKNQKPLNSDKINPLYTGSGKPVYFDGNGFPDFKQYVYKDASGKLYAFKIDMNGNYTSDFAEANKLAGFGNSPNSHPKGYTWHHH